MAEDIAQYKGPVFSLPDYKKEETGRGRRKRSKRRGRGGRRGEKTG